MFFDIDLNEDIQIKNVPISLSELEKGKICIPILNKSEYIKMIND
jgi:hypothetical protein